MYHEHREIVFKLHKLNVYCKLRPVNEGLAHVTVQDMEENYLDISTCRPRVL